MQEGSIICFIDINYDLELFCFHPSKVKLEGFL